MEDSAISRHILDENTLTDIGSIRYNELLYPVLLHQMIVALAFIRW